MAHLSYLSQAAINECYLSATRSGSAAVSCQSHKIMLSGFQPDSAPLLIIEQQRWNVPPHVFLWNFKIFIFLWVKELPKGLRWHKDWFTVFLLFGKGIGCMQREASNWALGRRPTAHNHLFLSLSKTVNKILTWHSETKAGKPFSWFNGTCVSYQRNMEIDAFSPVCFFSSHGNRYSYLNADHLNEKQSYSVAVSHKQLEQIHVFQVKV